MLLIFLALAAGPSDGKTAALDDWHAMTILQVAGSPGGSEQTLRVAAGDLDGDGLDDDAFVKIECADGAVRQAHSVVAPRWDVVPVVLAMALAVAGLASVGPIRSALATDPAVALKGD